MGPEPFRVVQSWGRRDKVKESTVVSSHPSAGRAFAAIAAMVARFVETGAPPDAVELLVVNANGRVVQRRTR